MTTTEPKRPLAVTALARAYDLQCPRYMLWILNPESHRPQRMEDTPAGRELSKHGIEHEELAISLIAGSEQVIEPDYSAGDLAGGSRITMELMEQNVPFIGQAPLYAQLSCIPFPIHGIVDLLRLSAHGTEKCYQVLEIKSSRRIKTSQMLQATIYGRMLTNISGIDSLPAPVVVDGLFHEHIVPVHEFDPIVTEFLETEIPLWLESGEDSFHRSHRCISCPFDFECKADAYTKCHSSIISGVSRGVAERITALGADSPVQLDTTEPERLRSAAMEPGFIQRIQRQSDAITGNRIISSTTHSILPSSTVELYLDIEPDPTGPHPCRLGLLKRDNSINRSAYRGRIMPTEAEDGWNHFSAYIDLLIRQIHRAVTESKSWLILYYGSAVAESIFELSDTSGTEQHLIDELFTNAVDVRTMVRRIWHLPVERYGLSDVLIACGLEPGVEDPGFILHRRWRSMPEDDRSTVEDLLLRHGERYCHSLLSLWDWMKSTVEHIHDG